MNLVLLAAALALPTSAAIAPVAFERPALGAPALAPFAAPAFGLSGASAFAPTLSLPGASITAPALAAPAFFPAAAQPVAEPSAAPAAAPAAAPTGADASAEYRAAFAAGGRLGDDEMRTLRGLRVLFVGGYLSNQVKLGRKVDPFDLLGFGDYFDGTMRWLRGQGVRVERVPVQTESTPEENAARVAAALRRSDRPVIVFTHSKGGLDTLEALRENPDLHGKVWGWVPQQAPFRGSPIADFFWQNSVLRRASGWALEKLGGGVSSLLSLTTWVRGDYMRRHADELRAIVARIPTVSFASFIEKRKLRHDTLFRLMRDRMERVGHKNDGLVPVESTILPGADHAVVDGLDHLLIVRRSLRHDFDQVLHARTLLGMILRRVAASRAAAAPVPAPAR